MASELQNSIFSAFDTIIEQHIDKLDLDKTVVASIEQCENALERKYRVQYKGGSMIAYAQSDETYAPHVSVYVSIPQNDFSQKKWILGRVSSFAGDRAITEVSAAIEDYQLVGTNTISVIGTQSEFGLKSYQPATEEKDTNLPLISNLEQYDVLPLYIRGNEEKSLLKINETELKQYIETSKAILLEANFRTDLDSLQRNRASKGAEYGLEFNFIFEDGNGEYESLGSQFEDLADITVIAQKKNSETNEIEKVTLQDIDNDITNKFAKEHQQYLEYTLTSAKAALEDFVLEITEETQANTLVELYLGLVKDLIAILKSSNSTVEDVIAERKNWFSSQSQTPRDKRIVYSLNSDNMLGNPFLYRMSTEQYNIFPVDSGRFKYIESIIFYCQHFNAGRDFESLPPDIFVSDIELYGLTELSAKNGDYCLKMQFPQGQMFETATNPDEAAKKELTVQANFYYKQELLSSGVEYYWFAQDGRVTSAGHENYHIRGGVGWRYLDSVKDETHNDAAIRVGKVFTTKAQDNTAYDNIYKCVVVYQDTMVLKAEFSLYNSINRRVIEINSSLGTKFDFDMGKPTLTCLLLDNIMTGETEPGSFPDGYGDCGYRYVWMRKDESGQVIVFDKTYQEYKELYDNISDADFNQLILLKKKMEEMKGIELNKNVLVYPASKIAANTTATFECYVYRIKAEEESYIGSASITLLNKTAPIRDEYYIIIENGNQVFQYNEAGALPTEEISKNPVKVKPLTCRLYNYLGQEVNPEHYTITWEYPLSNSLIIPPTKDLKENPRTGLIQWLHGVEATFTVEPQYDYSKYDNQIKCIVEYENNEITKETNFYFGKIGDNGTNGTDVVATIEPWGTDNDLDNEPLTLIVSPAGIHWNSGLVFNEATTPLSLSLFRNNEYVEPSEYKNVKWTMAGGATQSNRFTAQADATSPQLAHILAGTGKYSNYIIKGEAKLEKVDGNNEIQTHYAFYPICVIEYEAAAFEGSFSINKDKTLKHILYNADGRNPLYNENQGVFFSFSEDLQTSYSVSWEAMGGLNNFENTPAFDLYYDKDILKDFDTIEYAAGTLSTSINNCPYVYIKPKDVYAGAAQNNVVKATVYTRATLRDMVGYDTQTRIKVATVYIPIYMSLNLYGLASLNAWDGNTIEINEDNNYIMAPQIGAGVKNEDNTFTGVVMGKATTYDMKKEQIGLLGYSGGRQSIFLDAETGNAIFGLTEVDDRQAEEDQKENYTEGRIELIPGGTSRIAGWNIGSRNLYNIAGLESDNQTEDGLLKDNNNKIIGYKDDFAKNHIMDIDHQREGIMLSANPAYISIKGRSLTEKDVSKETDRNINVGDSLELQLDPAQSSLFSIFVHKNVLDAEKQDRVWKRILLSGINEKGQFIANTLQNGSSSGGGTTFSIGNVDAFGDKYDDTVGLMQYSYTGAIFGATSPDNILDETKFFRIYSAKSKSENDLNAITEPTGAIHIDGGRFDSEYTRPINLHGAALSLYAGKDNADYPVTNHSVEINTDYGFIGHIDAEEQTAIDGWVPGLDFKKTGSFLRFQHEETSELHSKYHFNTYIGRNQDKDSNNWPWLFSEDSFSIPKLSEKDNNTANQTTRVSFGSLANYVYGNNKTDITSKYSGGHILNYATGSLQLNKAVQDDNNKAIVDKALQINDKNILFGNVDTFEHAENDSRESWGAELDKDNYTIGNIKLHSNIIKGFQFIGDSAGTTLASAPRLGLYSNDGIDIQELSGKGLYLGSSDDEDISYLLLKPNVNEGASVILRSEHGYIEFNGNAREGLHGTGASNGIYINPGFTAGYGVFTGNVKSSSAQSDFSIYAAHSIRAYDYYYSKDETSPSVVYDNSGNTTTYSYDTIWEHLVKLYELVSAAYARANSAYSKAESAAGSLPSHRHSFTHISAVTDIDWMSVGVRNAADTGTTTVGSVKSITTGGGGTSYTGYASA